MTSHCNYQWLRCLITGDEKWVLDINYKHRHPWLSAGETDTATPKSDRRRNESDAERLVGSQWYYSLENSFKWLHHACRSLLSTTESITENLKEKQDRIYYLHGNARLHVAKSTGEKLLKLGRIPVAHPPYSADLSPPDFHLFRCLCNHLREKKSNDENDVKIDLINFFGQKSKDLYEGGFLSLPECWR